jgi:hypothetical protein
MRQTLSAPKRFRVIKGELAATNNVGPANAPVNSYRYGGRPELEWLPYSKLYCSLFRAASFMLLAS